VMLTHWQSLFSNGRQTGLRVLAEVGRRVRVAWGSPREVSSAREDGTLGSSTSRGERARWVTCFELATEIAEGQWEAQTLPR
jgi:hypothetical protein